MKELLTYVFESGICLAVLFALYWMVLRKETYFRFNRIYLLGMVVVSCLIPQVANAINLPELSGVKETTVARAAAWNWPGLILSVYLTGAGLLLLRTLIGVIRIQLLKRSGNIVRHQGYSVAYLQREIAPFSFFKTVYLNKTGLAEAEERHILNHEITHIRQLHTLDILFLEIFLALFWFNPFMWFTRKALKSTHEYLADEGALNEASGPAPYQSLLLNQISGFMPVAVSHSFNSNIKNRIAMMCKKKSGLMARLKPLALLPALACLTFLFACNEQELLPEVMEPETEAVVPEPEVFVDEEVFYIVEEMPKFNGGDPATEFRSYVAQNLQYPEVAAQNKISGRVIVQFAVDSEGNVVDAVVVRGVNDFLDEEAVRVVMSSPQWTPGKQKGKAVKVLFNFPINFVAP
ncbi:MAG: M56 family metallopeptidase [Bacteroidales bacterium]|nr:M56 family metallopeptidase [Bacteroidales bacterium]